jgi:hypothetical protein
MSNVLVKNTLLKLDRNQAVKTTGDIAVAHVGVKAFGRRVVCAVLNLPLID